MNITDKILNEAVSIFKWSGNNGAYYETLTDEQIETIIRNIKTQLRKNKCKIVKIKKK